MLFKIYIQRDERSKNPNDGLYSSEPVTPPGRNGAANMYFPTRIKSMISGDVLPKRFYPGDDVPLANMVEKQARCTSISFEKY